MTWVHKQNKKKQKNKSHHKIKHNYIDIFGGEMANATGKMERSQNNKQGDTHV